MPLSPGRTTVLVVDRAEDVSDLDRKGQPQIVETMTPWPGCKLTPYSPAELRNDNTDYAYVYWYVTGPPTPAGLAVKPNGVLRVVDNGSLVGRTARVTVTIDGQVLDVAELSVQGAQPFNDTEGNVDHVTVIAKSEVG